MSEHFGLDDLDLSLIGLLMQDGRQTNVSLAKQVGTSVGTVRNRIQKLTESGVMQIVGVADPLKVGFSVHTIMALTVDHTKVREIAEQFASMHPVRYVAYVSGVCNLVVMSVFRSNNELLAFLREDIAGIAGIRRIQTMHVLETVKRSYNYFFGAPFSLNEQGIPQEE
jgi:Lrp/AsnC family transcriptional regulator for asnA, asnC and gidA